MEASDKIHTLHSVPAESDDLSWSMPLDEGILKSLPDEGTQLGYHVIAVTVRQIRDKLNDELAEDAPAEAATRSTLITQRITRYLRPRGMVVQVKVHGAGGSHGYQVTERGREMLAALRKEHS